MFTKIASKSKRQCIGMAFLNTELTRQRNCSCSKKKKKNGFKLDKKLSLTKPIFLVGKLRLDDHIEQYHPGNLTILLS